MSNHERESSRSPDGDAALDRAWQQLSDEQPPPALDAAIIAAAHKSIQGRNEQAQVIRASPPYRSWLTRWQPLAAAAAVAGLAFVLVQSLPRDRDVAPSLRMEEPATTPAAAQEQPSNPPARGDRGEVRKSPCASRRSGVRHGTGQHDRSGIRGRHGDDDACDRSRSTTACGAGDDGPNCVGRSGRGSCTGTGTDNSSESGSGTSKRQCGATGRHGPCRKGRGSLCRGRYRRRGRRTARVSCQSIRMRTAYLPESLRDWARTVE